MKNYIENRELILSSFGEDRKIVKELFLNILNGGFRDIYSDDKQTNNYLKLFEQEIFEFKIIFILMIKGNYILILIIKGRIYLESF